MEIECKSVIPQTQMYNFYVKKLLCKMRLYKIKATIILQQTSWYMLLLPW